MLLKSLLAAGDVDRNCDWSWLLETNCLIPLNDIMIWVHVFFSLSLFSTTSRECSVSVCWWNLLYVMALILLEITKSWHFMAMENGRKGYFHCRKLKFSLRFHKLWGSVKMSLFCFHNLYGSDHSHSWFIENVQKEPFMVTALISTVIRVELTVGLKGLIRMGQCVIGTSGYFWSQH